MPVRAMYTVSEACSASLRWLKHRYRVDDVPLGLRLPFLSYGYGVGLLFVLYGRLVKASSRVVHEGTEQLESCSNHIFCAWHESFWLWCVALRANPRQVLLANPDWFTKPVHVLMGMLGIQLILGATGRSGKRAAEQLLAHLRAGCSTTIAPDGPEGPAHRLHKGALHLSAQSGVPIIPVRFSYSRGFRLRRWDRQIMPLPFGTIRVRYGTPLNVRAETLDADARALMSAL